ncbi:hypothetical protein TRICHSKD4_1048 [Roseibium sp. TrichSKD4]|nr:hypothetical protein [Roseibium sp. TrichSKD4]EFO33929.1 hypothetical protein TRICHSKD4_1048 [Roseibium sp. TrichSKD4]
MMISAQFFERLLGLFARSGADALADASRVHAQGARDFGPLPESGGRW